jgi:hypothetical protein
MLKFEDLINKFPHIYIKEKVSNLGKLIQTILEELQLIESTKDEVELQDELNNATGITLDKHGELVGQERGPFSDDIYRILIKSKIRQNLSGGDVNLIIEYIATLFQIPRENMQIVESEWGSFRFSSENSIVQTSKYEGFGTGILAADKPEPAFYRFNITPESLNSIGFPIQDLVKIVKDLSAAGVRISFFVEGTFAFSATNGVVEYSEESGFDYGTLGAYYNPDEGFFS